MKELDSVKGMVVIGYIFQEHLQAFLEASHSEYGCLVCNGKLFCATDKWWLLDGDELALLGRVS